MTTPAQLSQILWSEAVCGFLDLQDYESLRLCSHSFRRVVQLALPGLIARVEGNAMELSMSEQLRLEDEEDKAGPDPQKMQRAQQSLQSLTKADITALRSMKSPPPLVASTMEALRVLLQLPKGENPFARTDLLMRLINFDLSTIRPATMKVLEKYVQKCDIPSVRASSIACAGVCQFLHAVYNLVLLRNPKKRTGGVRAEIEALQRTVEIAKKLESKAVE